MHFMNIVIIKTFDDGSLSVAVRTFVLLMLFLLGGCVATTNNVKQIDRLDSVNKDAKILIMTPNVKYYLLTVGGVPEPHAEWTKAARVNFSEALKDYADEREVDIVVVDPGAKLSDEEISYQTLYSAVGRSILLHYIGPFKLPTKQESFDWSLGPGVKILAEKYGVDYALFSYYRDYEASGGRVAFSIIAAIAGAGVSTGSESGFASLVDLRSGDIVWFNRVTSGAGELKEKDGARATIDVLFKDLPTNVPAKESKASSVEDEV